MRQWTWLVASLAVYFAGLAGPRPAAAQTSPTLVALSGTPAPAGGNYSGFNYFFSPVVNGSGQVAFLADLTGGSSTQGVFVGAPGTIQAAALQGTAAPAGGNYSRFINPVLNESGQLAFRADLTGGSSTQGIFVGAPGTIQAAALQGAAAPAGGNYSSIIDLNTPVLNGSGQVAFAAMLTGGSSTQGLFVGAPGAMQTVGLQGAAAPAGGNYSRFGGGRKAVNGSGQVAFYADLTGGSSTQGLFVGRPGAVQAFALQGTAAPAGGNYNEFPLIPTLNGSGQVAFVADLTGGSSSAGIFVGAPGALQAAALSGTAAPAGGNYARFAGLGTPLLNGSGQVAFAATLTGGSSSAGIFVGAPGAVQTVALQGTPAPGGGDFKTFSYLNVPNPSGFMTLNASGQVAFLAFLTGAGVTAANDQGLYAGSVGGLVKVVRSGDQLDVDPGPGVDLRTIANAGIQFTASSGGEDGWWVAFNNSGLITYGLTFTDGSSGIFRSSIAPVPEPASAGLIAAAGLAALGWLKRRGGWRASFNLGLWPKRP